MVIESLNMYVILIPLKIVSVEAVVSALYTYMFSKHGVCNTILLTDRRSAFRSALVKAIAQIFKVKEDFVMTARPTTLAQVEPANKLIYNYLQAVCKREEDWSTRFCTIAMGHNHCSITGSKYFSPYCCVTGRNLALHADSKLLKSKHSGNTVVDEFVRTLLLKFDHIRELAMLNVQDFKANYKKRMTDLKSIYYDGLWLL